MVGSQFIQLSSAVPKAPLAVMLQNPTNAQVAAALIEFNAALSHLYDYAPVDLSKLPAGAISPTKLKPLDCLSLANVIASQPLSKVEQEAAKLVTLKLDEPKDESEVKKHKQKTLALSEIAVDAVLFAHFVQVFPPSTAASGIAGSGKQPAKKEMRLVANMDSWKIVKKVDMQAGQPKEFFSSMAQMHGAIRKKIHYYLCKNPGEFENYLSKLLADVPERRSYSRLQQKLSALNHLEIAATCKNMSVDPKLAPALIELVYHSVFERCGFPPYVSAETIGELYPELKITKPRGNFGSKKK